jgi:hypothetical protein
MQGVEYCMERMNDTSAWASLNVTDIDDAKEILEVLAEPTVNDNGSLAEEMAVTD